MIVRENYTRSFDEFHDSYIKPLGKMAVATHYQLFPGNYPTDWGVFEETKASGKPLPTSRMPETYRAQVVRAKRLQAPFRRLRVLPDVGQMVGRRYYSSEDIRAMTDMSRRNVEAGEDVRIISYGEVEHLVPRTGVGPYMDEYFRGVKDGVPRLSFWTVGEAKPDTAPDIQAVRLTSYDRVGNLTARLCLPGPPHDEELTAYLGFWQNVYGSAMPLR